MRGRRRSGSRLGLGVVVAGLGLVLLAPTLRADSQPDAVAAAFERARDAGSYAFTSDVEAVTAPVASALTAGSSSHTDHLHLEGTADLERSESEFSMWTGPSGAYTDDTSVGFRMADGTTYRRRGAGEWEESATTAPGFAPQGDQLGFLLGAANVVDLGLAPGTDARRYGFDLDGPEFAAAMARELASSMRERGELPANAQVSIPAQYRDMTGEGELWVDESTGLPLRIDVTVRFPPQGDSVVTAGIRTDFSRFGYADSGPTAIADRLVVQPLATGASLIPVLLLAVAVFMLCRRHPDAMRPALVIVVVFAMLFAGPLAPTASAASGDETSPAARAATGDADVIATLTRQVQLEGAGVVDPHLDRMAAVGPPLFQVGGVDTDGDGIPDEEEQELGTDPLEPDSDGDGLDDDEEIQIGTDPLSDDTDGDGYSDLVELEGFTLPGDTTVWYPDPNLADSNDDGIPDSIEWDVTDGGTPADTDGDGVPDLFDTDNDGDGVPDHRDLSPFTAVNETFDDENPLALTLDGLTPGGLPTFVELQLRPANPDHLRFALRPLDWPQDLLGQIRDVNDSTDDLSLVPMLEIGFPTNAPVVPDADVLAPYSIRLNDTEDPDTAYVPLSMITDERTSEQVAFGGRMRYQSPGAGRDWGGAHEVRLVWTVRVDNDIACTPGDPDPLPGDPDVPVDSVCGADGYRYDRPQSVHTYTGGWTMTGLQVIEEHGAQTALIHEDPAVDDDDLENGPTWALADVLSERLLTAMPDGGGNDVYALELDDLAARFDHASASTVDDRYGLPDVFSVDQRSHDTFDDAMRAVTEDVYDEVLPRYGSADGWNVSTSSMPLVMTVYATDTRTLTLDDRLAVGDRVQWTGHALRLDVVPAIDRTRSAGLSWGSYCGGTASSPVWSRCDIEQVGDRLESRYSDVNVDVTDPTRLHDEAVDGPLDPEIVRGQNIVMMGYYLAVANGISTVLSTTDASGVITNLAPYESDTDEELRSRVVGGARVAKTAAQMLHFKYLEGATNFLRKSLTMSDIVSQSLYKVISDQGILSTMRRGLGTKLFVGAVVVGVIAVGVAVGFALAGNEDAAVALGVAAQVAGTVASLSVFVPFAHLSKGASAASALASLKGSSVLIGITKAATFVGTVIMLGVVWGFFINEMVSNGVVAGSPAFNAALSTVLATSIFIVLLAVLSLTIGGALLVGIVGAIDGILTLICEYGSDDDRDALTVDGQCFTLGGSIIKALSDFLYMYDPLVDLGRDDLVSVEVPDDEPLFRLADPTRGYAEGNALDVTLDVTTDIRHAFPRATVKPYYLSADSLIDSTFEYSVTSPAREPISAELGQMRSEWETPTPSGSHLFTPLLRTTTTERVRAPGAITLNEPGLSVLFLYRLNMGYATPALECWVPYLLPYICDVEPLQGGTSIAFDPVFFDVFPATIDDFLATIPTADGHRFEWDRGFGTIADFDGDGLRSAAAGGLDPDDTTWDTDGDGLSDAFELAQRETGVAFSPTSADTDGDGLDDADEFRYGTDPAVVDSDRDGLSDAEEIEGWEITLERTGRTVRVTSDPLAADTDLDGIGDEAERFLAADGQYDENGRAFHPRTTNVPPLSVTISSDAPGGFVRSGQPVEIETTVEATVPLGPSVLDLDTRFADPLPVVVDFDPATFDGSQTVTRTDSIDVSSGATGDLGIGVDVHGRLVQDPLPPDLDLTSRPPMASSDPRASVDVTPMRVDTGTSFVMFDEAHDGNGFGSVWPRVPGTGIDSTLELDQDTDTTVNPPRDDWAQRKSGGVSTACTDEAECMTVWPYAQNCMAVTVNSIRVNDVSDQNGDLEVGVYLNRTSARFDIGEFEQLWHSVADGPGSLNSGPTTYTIDRGADLCGFGYLAVVETDGEDRADLNGCDGEAPESTNCKPLLHPDGSGSLGLRELSMVSGDGPGTYDATFRFQGCPASNCDEVVVNYTLKAGFAAVNGQVDRLAAAVTDGASRITRTQFGIRGVGPDVHDHAPAIASDGDRFLVVWTTTVDMPDGRVGVQFMGQEYDRTGAPVGGVLLVETAFFQERTDPVPTLDIAWARGRAPVIVANIAEPPGEEWTFVKPLPSTLSADDSVDLAIDAQSGVATAVSVTADGIWATRFQAEAGQVSDALETRRVIMLGTGNTNALASPVVARVPGVGGWLIGVRYVGPDNADLLVGRFSDAYFLTKQTPRGNPSAPATTGELVRLDADFAIGHSVTCASGDSTPVVDLRFEELPGATEFEDSSRLGNHATNATGQVPAAGLAPSPATDSNFAALLRSPQRLELPNTAEDAITLSVWVRRDPGSSPLVRTLTVRDPQAGYFLDVGSFDVEWKAGGVGRTEFGNDVDRPYPLDGDWHHVVVTRSSAGTGSIYVDGQPWAEGFAMGDPVLAPLEISGDGVLIDDFKMFDRALTPVEVEALMNQTPLDRCVLVAAEGPATGNADRYPWAELTLTPHDPVAVLLASAQLELEVDDAGPAVTVAAVPGAVRGGSEAVPATFILSGNASDPGAGVARVEVSVDGGPYVAAEGLDTWSYALPVVDGSYDVRVRAVDAVGNVGFVVRSTVIADANAPAVSLDALPGTPVAPDTDPATGAPTVALAGSASDAVSGVATDGVEVQIVPSPSVGVAAADGWQPATLDGDRWELDYRFSTTAVDVSGAWDVRVRATDGVGNTSPHDDVAAVLHLDANAPEAHIGDRDAVRQVIAGGDLLELAGDVTDADGAGVTGLEISLTPLATLLALPDGATIDDLPEPPTWSPVDLAESGPGVTETSWTFDIVGDYEDSYQVDLRTTDAVGNQAVRPNVWRGVIDTTAPRLVLSAEPTGATHTGGTRFEVGYECVATDLFLDPDSFDCDGGSAAPPIMIHQDDAAVQAEFPDLPLLEQMATAFTRWERGPETDVRFAACDLFGNCTTLAEVVDDGGVAAADLNAVIVDPTDGLHVATDGTVDVAVVADAAASIRSLVVAVDGVEAARLEFADGEVTTYSARVPVDVVGGTHTIELTVVDWAGTTGTAAPVTFFADTQVPAVSIDSTAIAATDTWGPGSEVIRFNGAVSDDGTIASVEIKVGDGEWTDVIVDAAGWRGALAVPEADGTALSVQVRANDLAGRSATVSDSASVDLGPGDPNFERPETTIVSGPAGVTSSEDATFEIAKVAGSNEVVALSCSLDGGVAVPCPESWTVDELSSGDHRVEVAAVDSSGYEDLSPAIWEWTVTPTGPQVEFLDAPEDPTSERTASFTFSSEPGATFECRLDDGDFEPCTSPITEEGLPDGAHRFEVRARVSDTTGTATPHVWSIVNAAPVAHDQHVIYGDGAEGTPIVLSATDADPVTYRVVDGPEHGFLEGAGPDRTYRPVTGFAGADRFTFQAFDGEQWSNPATVTLEPGSVLTWPTPAPIVYGTPLTADHLNASAPVPGTLTYEPGLGTRLAAGTHTLSVTFVPDDQERYDSLEATVTIEVTPRPLRITASSESHLVGTEPPDITPIFDGFAPGDDPTVLETAPVCESTSTGESPAGSYVSSCTGASDPDYEITYVDGVVTVTVSPLSPELDAAARFVPLDPARLFDTRPTERAGGPKGTVGPDASIDVQIAGSAGVPVDAVAVVMNVTATDSRGPGFITVWPTGTDRPTASSINVIAPGQTRPNLVTVPIGEGGKVSLYSLGAVNLLGDVVGYYADTDEAVAAGRFVPLTPERLFDTRDGTATPGSKGKLASGGSIEVPVLGVGSIPDTGVAAVVVNLTGTESNAPGFLTAYPTGLDLPTTSNVNLGSAGTTAPNLAIVPIGDDGTITVFSSHGAHVIVDVAGYITGPEADVSVAGLFVPIAPERTFDTRESEPAPGPKGYVSAGDSIDVQFGGVGSIPADAAAVMVNVTGINSPLGYLTAWERGPARPSASTLNFVASPRDIRANGAMLALGEGGQISFFTLRGSHILGDTVGYYLGPD